MIPSDTPRGQAWLSNFKDEERGAARLLVDGLDLVGAGRLHTDLTTMIEGLAASLPKPIALVPVRELAAGQSYYRGDRYSKPALLLPGSFPGSEAIVANLAASLRRAEESQGPFVAAPSLANMRAARCRTVLFIEDFSGSGDRILKFDRGFRRHPTIKSWLSLKWIQIHVGVFAATSKAEERLKAHFGEPRVHVHRICPTFNVRSWTLAEVREIEKLCREYHNPRVNTGPYGYGNSKGLMAFVHSVPNNIPPILWQTRGPSRVRWRSFFQNQSVPSELHCLFGDASAESRAEATLQRLGQARLAEGAWRTVGGNDPTRILLILAALARRPAQLSRVMALTGLAASEITAILGACRKWGLVDNLSLRLTDSGLRELAHAKGVTLYDTIPTLRESHEPYYPRALRVGR